MPPWTSDEPLFVGALVRAKMPVPGTWVGTITGARDPWCDAWPVRLCAEGLNVTRWVQAENLRVVRIPVWKAPWRPRGKGKMFLMPSPHQLPGVGRIDK